jgi:hypothetical protein
MVAYGEIPVFKPEAVFPAIVGECLYGGFYQTVSAIIPVDFYAFDERIDIRELVAVLNLRFDFQFRTFVERYMGSEILDDD